MLSGASRDRPVIVGWSIELRGQVINEQLAAGPAKRQNSRPTFPPRMPPGRIQMAAPQFSADRDTLATRHELWRKENAGIALVSSQLPHGFTSCDRAHALC